MVSLIWGVESAGVASRTWELPRTDTFSSRATVDENFFQHPVTSHWEQKHPLLRPTAIILLPNPIVLNVIPFLMNQLYTTVNDYNSYPVRSIF